MKKVFIIDGNKEDAEIVKEKIGDDFDVSSVSGYEVSNMALSTVITIANTIDSLDSYCAGKSLRVAVIAKDIAANLGWDEERCRNLYFIALLHDIGMITIPDSIIHKPGRLTESEYEIVKRHTIMGSEMLRDITILNNLTSAVACHHERWDGCGYPKKMRGKNIPEEARIIAIADAYVAMSSDRVYRSRMSPDKIISEFMRCRGTQFDPEMVDVFIFMLKGGYTVDPGIEQTREASDRAASAGGFKNIFTVSGEDALSEGEKDALTGLFTRSYLNTMVQNKIAQERSGAMMIIHITGFEDVKAKLGQEVGDKLLQDYSDRLRSFFREADIVCRIFADQFAVYVSGESGKSVIEKKAGMITGMIDTYDEFTKYRGIAGAAIGISMCQEDGVTFEELYGVASSALEDARSTGESTYRFRDVKHIP